MGTFLFNALLGMLFPTGPAAMLVLLSVAALVVGLLARLMQPFHGLITALVAGTIAALLLFYLRQAGHAEAGMRLVFGPAGALAVIGFASSVRGSFPFCAGNQNETAHHLLQIRPFALFGSSRPPYHLGAHRPPRRAAAGLYPGFPPWSEAPTGLGIAFGDHREGGDRGYLD